MVHVLGFLSSNSGLFQESTEVVVLNHLPLSPLLKRIRYFHSFPEEVMLIPRLRIVSGTIAGATYGVAKSTSLVAVKVLDGDGAGTTSGVVNRLAVSLLWEDRERKSRKDVKPKAENRRCCILVSMLLYRKRSLCVGCASNRRD